MSTFFPRITQRVLTSVATPALTACAPGGGDMGLGSGSGGTTTYTVGGTVSGLSGTGLVLLNYGFDSVAVSAAGAFTFATGLPSGGAYSVTVGTQPAGQDCVVSSGSGTVATANVTNIAVSCAALPTADVWTWRGGSTQVAPSGVYGTMGVPAAANAPGGRNWTASWKDASGNFWVFGGQGYDSTGAASGLNDLWQYNPTTALWTWMKGSTTINATGVYGTKGVASAANVPGARESMLSWIDASGDLFLFGGYGYDSTGAAGYLNDLWRYDPSNGQWTWVGGPNTANTGGVYGTLGTEATTNLPGARFASVSWTDATGNVWLFGGYGVDSGGSLLGHLNDLWRYNTSNGLWTWMGGSDTYGAIGVYGTKGTAAPGNVPGARSLASAWMDTAGNLWCFGGLSADAGNNPVVLNDLWRYDPVGNAWTWMSGSSLANATGIYGTQGTAAAANAPGARAGSMVWADTAGNLWIFGGAGLDSRSTAISEVDDLNDLWRYDVATGNWTWVNGSNQAAASGVYGTLDRPSLSTQPGARDSGAAWTDGNGHVWLFGGAGYDASGVYDSYGLNDVFEYIP